MDKQSLVAALTKLGDEMDKEDMAAGFDEGYQSGYLVAISDALDAVRDN